MRALLVNPWITDFAAFDLWVRPLGLLYTGAFLRRRGHEVRLVDCLDRYRGGDAHPDGTERQHHTGSFPAEAIPTPPMLDHVHRRYRRYGITPERFDAAVMEGLRPDVVLVTCLMTYWYPGAFAAIERIRGCLPDVPIMLGGIYPSLCPDHARTHSGADLVIGHGSPRGIVEAAETLAGSRGDGPFPGEPFSCWPEPAWELYRSLPAATVMTSRGCPLRCDVCASHLLTERYERRDPADAAHALLRLTERGVRDIAFTDDAILIDPDRHAAPLFELLAGAGASLRLHSPNGLHVREITPALARIMRRGGLVTVRLSLETADDTRAAAFSGKVNRGDFQRAARALMAAGYGPGELGAYILAGLPGQAVGEVLDTARFVHGCGVPVKPALFSPVPGTQSYNDAVRSGMIPVDADPLMHNNTIRTADWFPGGAAGYQAFREEISRMNCTLPAGA